MKVVPSGRRRLASWLFLLLALCVLSAASVVTIFVPDDYADIQWANAASAGDITEFKTGANWMAGNLNGEGGCIFNYANIKTEGSNTYYVAPWGNDRNPGTIDQPWRTIQHAAETLLPGDTVYIKEGIYNERVIPQNSGSPGNYITYTAYPGDTVIIDGADISLPAWGGLFDLSDKAYINISGLKIINAGPNDNNAGILVDNCSHITIKNCYTYNTTSSGIGVWDSNNITIDGNEVVLACDDGEQECITVANTNTFVVKNNRVHHSGPGTLGGEGIDIKDGSSNGKVYKNVVHDINRLGIYVDAWDKHTYNIEVYKNIVYNCSGDGFCVVSEKGGLLENVSFYNNIAYNNEENGFSFGHYGENAPSRPLRNIKVVNNVFYNNGKGTWGGGISVESEDAEDIVIRNNIVSQNLIFQIQVEVSIPNLTIDHNLIDGYRGYEYETNGTDYVAGGGPLFVNAPAADFHLQAHSPAIDNGSLVDAPNDDFDGTPRPQGAGYDIGAFEFASNLRPIPEFSISPSPAFVNQTVIFNASLSYDPDGSITNYEWDFGNENETRWDMVDSWLYQLQNIDLGAIANSSFDLVVIDYSTDGTEDGEFTYGQINNLKKKGKLVVAYMSIGEAENYRYYWNSSWDADDDGIPDAGAPSWLDRENPEWEGNYKVRYWETGWQNIIFGSPDSYLDKIMAAGFDGVYLDCIDAYEYYAEQGRETAEQEMVDFVKAISKYAKERNKNFGIFPQNGEALAEHPDYIVACTGIGKEDTWYDGDIPQDGTYTDEVLRYLDMFKQRNKLVLVVDYCRNPKNIDDFYEKALKKGYVPYATVRDLDALIVNPRHTPGEVVSHSYTSAGEYTVTLTVTDDDGATNSTAKRIVVREKPSVGVATDKYEYAAGDLMLIGITLRSSTAEAQPVRFSWRLDFQDYDLGFPIVDKLLVLPPNFERAFMLRWRLPNWRVAFDAAWHVALYDAATSELISEDEAAWRYVPDGRFNSSLRHTNLTHLTAPLTIHLAESLAGRGCGGYGGR